MSFHSARIVVTDDGVYQPPIPLKLQIALLAGLLLLVVVNIIFFPRLPWFIGFYTSFALGLLANTWLEYRRHGPLGRPKIACLDGTLVLALDDNMPHDEFKIAVSEIRKLVVYGPAGNRIYRFLKNDRTYVEVVPPWSQKLENCAIDFFQRLLTGQLVVEEPQTAFASIRGDGPCDES